MGEWDKKWEELTLKEDMIDWLALGMSGEEMRDRVADLLGA